MKLAPGRFPSEHSPHDEIVTRRCEEFESQWVHGQSPRLEEWLAQFSPSAQETAFVRLLKIDLQYRAQQGETVSERDYHQRFPQYSALLSEVFQAQNSLAWDESHARSHSSTKIWSKTPAELNAKSPNLYIVNL